MVEIVTERNRRLARRIAATVALAAIAAALAVVVLWRQRAVLDDVGLPAPAMAESVVGEVSVTWLGTAALLFDDGETQLLIDGLFSRPTITELVLGLDIRSEAAVIDRAMHDFGMRRVAAVIASHSHFDHALDSGAVANRSDATVVGSASVAHIASGAAVPAERIAVAENGAELTFGAFGITLLEAPHAAFGWGGNVPLDGDIDAPVEQPVPATEMRAGTFFTVVVRHPTGTAIVQGSAGFVPGRLGAVEADAVFLGIGMLGALGRDYAADYWRELVTATGAKLVVPVHFDDYTQPFGETQLPPTFIDDVPETAGWLREFQRRWDTDARLVLPVFGQPMTPFAGESDEV